MGYKPPAQHIELHLAAYPGLEVTMASATVGELFAMGDMPANIMKASESERETLLAFFGDRVIAWNMEHPDTRNNAACNRCGLVGGEALPPNSASFNCLDFSLVAAIIGGWMFGIVKVSIPKELNTMNGMQSPEEILQMISMEQNHLT